MKKIIAFLFTFFCISIHVVAQTSSRYIDLTMQAMNSYQNHDYKKAGLLYSQAFKSNMGKAYEIDRYNAASAWAQANNKDSAFVQLFKVANLFEYDNISELNADSMLIPLHADARWVKLCDKVKQNIITKEVDKNTYLVTTLDKIYTKHQTARFEEVIATNQYSQGSKEFIDSWKFINETDSINLSAIKSIINVNGWLGKNVIGENGSATMAMVLLHADIATQEKFLPIMREAFKNKNIDAYDLAAMEDKVALRQGKQQIYGSNLISFDKKKYYISPMIDPQNVNKRRAELGLNTMNEYLVNWKMKWDVSKYKNEVVDLANKKIQY